MSDKKPIIFISYSHKDRSWLDYVRSFFEPLAKQWTLLTWDDEKVRIGDDWKGDIYSALDSCGIFVLLVSRYALASDFILNDEVGRVLKRPKGEVQFCPIVVTPYFAEGLDWLDHPNRRPPDDKALSELLDPARDREMVVIARQIYEIVQKISGIPITRMRSPTTHTSRTAFPSIVDYGRLPETPYKKLVGRDDELRQLDEAWADEKTRIISLVAWGGAGKTSLVIEWLMRVRNDGYRNANAVLCWSFFSQGTKERAVSGDGFLDWALEKLKIKIDTTSSAAKGERLANEMSRRRVLLVLDGLEPLQYGPEGQPGALKDQGVRAFLRDLAVKQPAADHSLVVLTSRLAVHDLRKWQDTAAPVLDLTRLSDEAGAALLEDSGVIGSPEALREAAHDFAGHALALSLLAAYLKLLHNGDVGQGRRVRVVPNDTNDSGHDQARRVIEAYHEEWLAGEPALRAIMYMVGLFDRPASADCIKALRNKPIINDLTSPVVDLDEGAWQSAIALLRGVRLLDPEDPSSPDALNAHPLVREWFGDRLRQVNEATWKAAHGRLYEHLRETTKEGRTPTLQDLAPLYQAIAHGCRAGRHQEALDKIYVDRICRWTSDGRIEFYAINNLGALGSDLEAISWFFDRPYEEPITTIREADRSWVLGEAARYLRAQGRFTEALPAQRAALRMVKEAKNWVNAGFLASNLSEAELLVGDVSAAVANAKLAFSYADQCENKILNLIVCTTYADALYAVGQRNESEILFAEAERLEGQRLPDYPLLYSLRGFHYCDLLIAKGDYAVARDRASQTLEWAKEENWILDIALDTMTLGRAHLGLALSGIGTNQKPSIRNYAQIARSRLDEANEGLQAGGLFQYIALGFLARATFACSVGDWVNAARDLGKVQEIAEPGPMKLFLCDMALERARLAFAKMEAFAPLNGYVDDSPPKPILPDIAEAALLKAEAAKQLAVAAHYIKTCGYHRRDEELTELEGVLHGERQFADLAPRV